MRRLTLLFRSPIEGQIFSSAGVDSAMILVLSSVAKGVEGSDVTSSEFAGCSELSSCSLFFVTFASFSSLKSKINFKKI